MDTYLWCADAISLGHNLIDKETCEFNSAGDLTGVSTGLLPLSIEGRNGSGDLGPSFSVFLLGAASLAIDSANPEFCKTKGVLSFFSSLANNYFDGDGDGIATCDRGAIEYIHTGLSDGGANGLFYDPNQDGHYVYVLDNNANTLVVWNTFDVNGNQAWIFATGKLANGKSLIADAFINEIGVLTEKGPENVTRDKLWGTIQLELDSCNKGKFFFTSDLPGFTSGQFELKRLAVITQIGCQD